MGETAPEQGDEIAAVCVWLCRCCVPEAADGQVYPNNVSLIKEALSNKLKALHISDLSVHLPLQ